MANHFAVSHKIVRSIAFHRTYMYVFCCASVYKNPYAYIFKHIELLQVQDSIISRA